MELQENPINLFKNCQKRNGEFCFEYQLQLQNSLEFPWFVACRIPVPPNYGDTESKKLPCFTRPGQTQPKNVWNLETSRFFKMIF